MLIETQDLTILYVNDCILETPERLQTIKRHVSRCDILFTQFSYANWEDRRDNPQARRALAAEKLRRITLQCEAFRPRFVVPRSEEHRSELQSLMPISSPVLSFNTKT